MYLKLLYESEEIDFGVVDDNENITIKNIEKLISRCKTRNQHVESILLDIRHKDDLLLQYATEVIKGRWPEAEEIIKKNPIIASKYSVNVIKGRWPEAEEIIKKNSCAAYIYAKDVIKGRWPEGEEIIKKDPGWAYYYSVDVIKGTWPEAEETLLKDIPKACMYATYTNKKWPELEKFLPKYPEQFTLYWAHFDKDELNKNIQTIEQSPFACVCYLITYQRRDRELEKIIKTDAYAANMYAKHVVKGRWPEGEEAIKKSKYWESYKKFFKITESKITELEEREDFVDSIIQKLNVSVFKKQLDPLRRSELKAMSNAYPERSGNQNTPLSNRNRLFFNSPNSNDKGGYAPIDDVESRHALKNSEDDYPIDKTNNHIDNEKSVRKQFKSIKSLGYKNRLYW